MNRKLNLIVLTVFSCTIISSQENPSSFLRSVYSSFQKKDTALFLMNYISYQDLTSIVAKSLLQDSAESSKVKFYLPEAGVIEKYESMLKDSIFSFIIKQANESHIDIAGSVYSDCSYQILKTPAILIPSLTGSVYFKEGNTTYELKIKEALWVDEKWKLHDIGMAAIVSGTSVFNQDSLRISAFGSFDIKITDVKIKDIKLTDIKNEPVIPPPPPPPKPSKSKRKRV